MEVDPRSRTLTVRVLAQMLRMIPTVSRNYSFSLLQSWRALESLGMIECWRMMLALSYLVLMICWRDSWTACRDETLLVRALGGHLMSDASAGFWADVFRYFVCRCCFDLALPLTSVSMHYTLLSA